MRTRRNRPVRVRTATRRPVKTLAVAVIAAIAIGLVGGTAAYNFFNTEQAPKNSALDAKDTGNSDDQNVPATFSREDAKKKYGDELYVLQSSFLDMASVRNYMGRVSGLEKDDAVSIPMATKQEEVDAIRAKNLSADDLKAVLTQYVQQAEKDFENCPADEVIDKICNEIRHNVPYAYMTVNLLLKVPGTADMYPELVKFKTRLDETFARTDASGLPVGITAWVHYTDAEAALAGDMTSLVINTEDDLEKGLYEFFYPSALLSEVLRQSFVYEGLQNRQTSLNYHLPIVTDDPALQQTREADYQIDKKVYVFRPRFDAGKTVEVGFGHHDRRGELFVAEQKKAEPQIVRTMNPSTTVSRPPQTGNPPTTTENPPEEVPNEPNEPNEPDEPDQPDQPDEPDKPVEPDPGTPPEDGEGLKDPEASSGNKPENDQGSGANENQGPSEDQTGNPDGGQQPEREDYTLVELPTVVEDTGANATTPPPVIEQPIQDTAQSDTPINNGQADASNQDNNVAIVDPDGDDSAEAASYSAPEVASVQTMSYEAAAPALVSVETSDATAADSCQFQEVRPE